MNTMTASTAPVLADLLPGARIRDVMLVVSSTLFLTVAGQLTITLWFTPVPLSLATFAILLGGAALGPLRASLSILLYIGLGLAGVPMFANHASGWDFASFGYILGYLPAALLVGLLARKRADRSLPGSIVVASLGSVAIYAAGVPWLMAFLDVDLASAMKLGVYPFLVGDLLKAAAAAGLLPATWKLINRGKRNQDGSRAL